MAIGTVQSGSPPINYSSASNIMDVYKDLTPDVTHLNTYEAVQQNPSSQTAINDYVNDLFNEAVFDAQQSGTALDTRAVSIAATEALKGAGVTNLSAIGLAESKAAPIILSYNYYLAQEDDK